MRPSVTCFESNPVNIRPAEIGDQGTLATLRSHGSIVVLVLQISAEEQAYLFGDWRMVADLVEAFGGQRVEVVEGEGSPYGAHDIRPVEPTASQVQRDAGGCHCRSHLDFLSPPVRTVVGGGGKEFAGYRQFLAERHSDI